MSSSPVDTAAQSPWWELGPTRRRNNKHLVGFWLFFVVVTLVFPGSPADGIVFCPLRATTGLSCPGCGMTRACTSMMHGEFFHSLEFHPLGWLFVAWITLMGMWRLTELVRGRLIFKPAPPRVQRFKKVATYGLFLFVVLFGGLRIALEIAGILTPV